jgi:hypothetical protein
VVVNDDPNPAHGVAMLVEGRATQIIGRTRHEQDDLAVTLQKLAARNAGDDGLASYVPSPRARLGLELSTSLQRQDTVEAIEHWGRAQDVNARLNGLLVRVADELISNALFNAPTDATGHRLHSAKHRNDVVALGEERRVDVRLRADAQRIGVGVKDPYGSLDRATIISVLARCLQRGPDQIDGKAGGAGLGLFFALDSVSHLVVNLEPGRSTEVLGLIDVDGGFRDFRSRPKSITLFVFEGER